MKKSIILVYLFFFCFTAKAQLLNKYGANRVVTFINQTLTFADTNKPTLIKRLPDLAPPYTGIEKYTSFLYQVVSDSATGLPKMYSDGFYVLDSSGNIVDGGENLVDSIFFVKGLKSGNGTIILPHDNDFYSVVTIAYSDSFYNAGLSDGSPIGPDKIYQSMVDMNANSGKGKVIFKKKNLFDAFGQRQLDLLHRARAVRHSNGKGWWLIALLRDANATTLADDSNFLASWYIDKDSVGPMQVQFLKIDAFFKLRISHLGSKLIFLTTDFDKRYISIANFNRCTAKVDSIVRINIPLDTFVLEWPNAAQKNIPPWQPTTGCFSANDRFVYLIDQNSGTNNTIWQYDTWDQDSATAWFCVNRQLDTSVNIIAKDLDICADGKLYLFGLNLWINAILNPNKKGMDCNFSRKYVRRLNAHIQTSSFSYLFFHAVQPNYTLGADPSLCWPLNTANPDLSNIIDWQLQPNPSAGSTSIVGHLPSKTKVQVLNSTGQVLHTTYVAQSTSRFELNLAFLPSGLYFVQVGNSAKKLLLR